MKKPYKVKMSKETIEKIIKMHHYEFLEAGEIAKILDIPEKDVARVISPHF